MYTRICFTIFPSFVEILSIFPIFDNDIILLVSLNRNIINFSFHGSAAFFLIVKKVVITTMNGRIYKFT